MQYDKSPKAEALIFDLDGTLADTMPAHFKAWKKACADHGIDLQKSFFVPYLGTAAWKLSQAIINHYRPDAGIDPESVWQQKIAEFALMQDQVRPIDAVVNIVKKYHGKLPMSVGTGGHKKAVQRTLEVTGLQPYFEVVVTANDVENHKPHPETFLRCAEGMGVEPAVCEVFEDGVFGLDAAKEAGMIPTDVRSWYASF